jgi:ACT domain-containing protein
MSEQVIQKAIVTVLGRDQKGIIAKVSGILYQQDVNILDISQTVLSDTFSMVMLVDVRDADFGAVSEALQTLGTELGQQIRIQRTEIFDAMHRI